MKRGRKSGAELDTPSAVLQFPVRHCTVPPHLPPKQKVIYERVVASMPAGWFAPEVEGLLLAYVCAEDWWLRLGEVLDSKEMAEIIQADGPRALATMVRLRDGQAAMMAKLATKLRMTPQSRYTPATAARLRQKQAGLAAALADQARALPPHEFE